MGESFPDGVFLHAGQPQARNRLLTSGLLINKPENQFALAPRVRSADHAVHVRAVHQLLQDTKLFFGAGRHQILPLLRQDGQICDTPLDVLGIVDIGRSKFHQMTNAPAYQIAVPFKVAILTADGTEDFCIGHSDGWLFRHD